MEDGPTKKCSNMQNERKEYVTCNKNLKKETKMVEISKKCLKAHSISFNFLEMKRLNNPSIVAVEQRK